MIPPYRETGTCRYVMSKLWKRRVCIRSSLRHKLRIHNLLHLQRSILPGPIQAKGDTHDFVLRLYKMQP